MSRQNNTTITAGEIELREGKRGIEFHAFNFQRQKMIHIGTVIGRTYEKVAPVLQMPEASFAFTQAEYSAVLEAGAQFIRIILPDKSATYAIDVESFGRYGVPYHNSFYGDQLRCTLDHFSYTSKTAPRNSHTDNPTLPKPGPLAPREKQLTLNGWMK